MNQGKIKQGEHVFVAGRTGSGKTFMVKKYLENSKLPVYVLDIKKTLKWVKGTDVLYTEKLSEALASKRRKIIYQPRWEEMEEEYYDEFFKNVYEKGDRTLWIDELMGVGTAVRFPKYYKACLTRGRELGISVWSCTQRPATIPIISMSEATHFFIFNLSMKKDRERIVEIAGHSNFLKTPGKYIFWYFDAMKEAAPVRAKLTERGEAGG